MNKYESIIIIRPAVDEEGLKALEDKIYGTENSEPTMPTISEIVTLLSK